MPSIPQSLLWISLVVLWLFVLVPMLISKRDAVRRTSDVALATRVLNTGRGARLLRRRGGPAAGHRSDPDWQPSGDDLDDDRRRGSHDESTERSVVRAAAVETEIDSEPDYLDVDVVDEDSGALPVGESANNGCGGAGGHRAVGGSNRRAATGFRRDTRIGRAGGRARARRHRRRVRVRRRFIGPGGAVRHRPAAGRVDERCAQAPLRVQDRRGGDARASTSSASGC